jgi:hypothetical protein
MRILIMGSEGVGGQFGARLARPVVTWPSSRRSAIGRHAISRVARRQTEDLQ